MTEREFITVRDEQFSPFLMLGRSLERRGLVRIAPSIKDSNNPTQLGVFGAMSDGPQIYWRILDHTPEMKALRPVTAPNLGVDTAEGTRVALARTGWDQILRVRLEGLYWDRVATKYSDRAKKEEEVDQYASLVELDRTLERHARLRASQIVGPLTIPSETEVMSLVDSIVERLLQVLSKYPLLSH